jgi:hypothetical protein
LYHLLPPITRAQLVGSSASTGAAGEPSAVPGRAGARVLRVGGAARMVRGGMELSSPLDLGIIDDWEAVEALWAHGLEQLRVGERCPHPLLVAEPAFSTAQQVRRARAWPLAPRARARARAAATPAGRFFLSLSIDAARKTGRAAV